MFKVKSPCKTRTGNLNANTWCHENLGAPLDQSTYTYRWMQREFYNAYDRRHYVYFYFAKEEHATWFLLSCSGA